MKYLSSLLLLLYVHFSQAQITPIFTNSQIGSGDNSDRYNAIIPDATGNLYLGGYTFNSFQDKDYLLSKMNSSGDTLWTRQFNGAANGADKILFMAVDGMGNVYVTGQSDGGSLQQNDILTCAYDDNGNLLWSALYNNPLYNQNDQPNGIAVDNSGNVFVIGETDRDLTANVNDDIITIKYNSSGVQQWTTQVNGTGNGTDRGNGIVTENTGGCVITGRTATTIDDDVITIKYNSSGAETWRTVYNRGFGNDRGQDIVIDLSGNLFVTGRSENANNYDVITIKYNSIGVAQWTKFYNGTNDDYGSYVKADASGNVYVTGQINLGTHFDIVTLKYNSTGVQQWVKTFGNAVLNDEDPTAILVDGSGNVYVTGKSDVNATAAIIADNFITLKYNSTGILQWSVYFNGTATNSDDIAEGMVFDATATNLYVAGGSHNSTTQKDATVIKYSTSTGIATWTKSYNGKGDFTDKAEAMIIDSKKNVYITGYVTNPEVRRDLFVAKLNSAGVTKWFVTYDFSQQDDEGRAITLDTTGNVYVCGSSIGNGTSDDYITIKLDTLGTIQWKARYNFNSETDVATSIAVNKFSGDVFVTGYSDQNISSQVTNYDIATVRYSALGNELSSVRYNGSGDGIDRAAEMAISPASLPGTTYLVIAGRTWNGTNYDIITLKYNGTLVQQWSTLYAGAKDDEARKLFFENSTGSIYVTGNTGTANHGFDIFLVKYNSSGVQQWMKTYNGMANFNDIGYSVFVSADGAYVTGRVAPAATGDTADLVTIKYDKSTGTQQWMTVYTSSANGLDRGWAITADQIGNIYTTGETAGVASDQDMITLGYDNTGRIRWKGIYDGGINKDDVSRVIGVDKSGYLYVGGYSTHTNANGFDAFIIKYCPPPPANAGTDITICKGLSTQLNASGGTNYLWTPITKLNNPNISNPIATPASTTSYVVTVDNGMGCVGKDTVIVKVNPHPNITITSSGPLGICQGDSVTFSIPSCSCTYQWKKGAGIIPGATTNKYTAKAKGTYSVTVTNQFGCAKTSKNQKVTIVCKNEVTLNEGVKELLVYAQPNPTTSFFTIQWQSNSTEDVTVDAYSLLGTAVYHKQGIQSGTVKFGNDLSAGMYFVKITQGSIQKIIKLEKEK